MTDACVIAIGAVSAFGEGAAAYDPGPVGEPAPTAIGPDPFLAEAGLMRARSARCPAQLCVPASADRASDLLGSAMKQMCDELDERLPGWRSRRIGVSIGTSSGGMLAAERFILRRAAGEPVDAALCNEASYFAPMVDALAAQGIHVDPVAGAEGDGVVAVKRCQVLAACASSTIAIGLGMRWLERGVCDVVLAGGYDGVSLFVASGFEAIRAISESMPQPFRLGRDGMLLGEGAGMVALVREDDLGDREPHFRVSGFGASADAVHITAPDRTGAGLQRAANAAMADASCDGSQIDLVSAHATSTPYNDAAESKAIHALCEPTPIVHPFKAQIGHTLGAAGVLETLAAAHALSTNVAPACYGDAPIDPEAEVPLLERAEARELSKALKLSAAFGGVTASLVVQQQPSSRVARVARPVYLHAYASIDDVDRVALSEATGIARDRLARIDDLGQLGMAAVAALVGLVGRDAVAGAGVVGGYALATLDTNERFMARMLKKGPRWVDPRLFPATSPNAGPGHCAIAFKLTGPNFAVCSGLSGGLEALQTAAELVASGDAERMVVLAADDAGPAAQAWVHAAAAERPQARGAVAALLTAHPNIQSNDQPGGRQLDLDAAVDHLHGPIGHLGLQARLKQLLG